MAKAWPTFHGKAFLLEASPHPERGRLQIFRAAATGERERERKKLPKNAEGSRLRDTHFFAVSSIPTAAPRGRVEDWNASAIN